jgi:hypothetical protein
MSGDVEPNLKNIGHRNSLSNRRSTENRFSIGRYPNVNISRTIRVVYHQTEPVYHIKRKAFQVNMRRDAFNKSIPQSIRRRENRQAGPRKSLNDGFAPQIP